LNRIERISAILIQLQSKKIVKAQEIADRFEISLRTVYRDIRALEATGVPLMGEAGIGYSLVDGYRLPPIMFSKEEAISFLTAEKLVEKFTDETTKNAYNSALYKIKAVLKSKEKNELNSLAEHIVIAENTYLPKTENKNVIEPILKSIIEKNQISIEYFTNYKQEKSDRIVEPVGIFHRSNNWYMIAYCTLRLDYRNFKINRISNLEVQDTHFTQNHPSLKSFLEITSNQPELQKIVIHISKEILRFLTDEKYYQGFVSEQEIDENKSELTFLSASISGFAVWFRMLESHAEIIEPQNLKQLVIDNIEMMAKKYKLLK
jgi:predicted DNA-binding transcriptional regulator YafY